MATKVNDIQFHKTEEDATISSQNNAVPYRTLLRNSPKINPNLPDTNAIETDPGKFCDFLHFHLDERAELRIADEDCGRLYPISNGPITYESAMEQIGAFIKTAIPNTD